MDINNNINKPGENRTTSSNGDNAMNTKPSYTQVQGENLSQGYHHGEPGSGNKAGKSKTLTIMLIVVGILLIGVGIAAYLYLHNSEKEVQEETDAAQAAKLELEEQLAASELENADKELIQLEGQRDLIVSDTLKMRLTQQYENARLQIENLQAQLRDNKNKSSKEIAKLRAEIDSLRKLLKHYLEEIARLNQENELLRAENEQIKGENQQLTSQVASATAQNQVLSERMTLAEKLNVTNVRLSALNSKGKQEKKVAKATQLVVTFTVPQNNSTPVGQKTFYVRVISPEGNLLGGAGSFSFEGGSVPCSAKKIVDYEGAELTDLKIYIDVTKGLPSGDYTVEIFADNYRLASKKYSL